MKSPPAPPVKHTPALPLAVPPGPPEGHPPTPPPGAAIITVPFANDEAPPCVVSPPAPTVIVIATPGETGIEFM
jgi:hypothetical protein